MPYKSAFFYTLLFLRSFCFSQTDSVEYTSGMPMEDGIYMSYDDFRHNKSISKYLINTKQDKEQLEFITKVLGSEKFSVKKDSTETTYSSKDVWGYFQNNTFYINYKSEF